MGKPLAQKLLENSFIRKIGRKVFYEYLKYQDAELTELISPQKVVLGGIFKGMKYPGFESSGSPLFTKMVGSYEDELNPFLLETAKTKYADIIDIGCAEGYYAVGLAMMHPEAKVHAYDIDPIALARCKAMAEVNGVSDRMSYGTKGEKATLTSFKYTGKGLVLCDCEGYEKEIFDEETARAVKSCDVIIELHDHVVPDIRQRIETAFKNTHSVSFVTSRLKSQKDYPLLAKLPEEYKDNRFVADRNTTMDWAVIRSTQA